jgi:hypothetical protein
MRSQPLASICIPSYDGEEFIAAAMESVLAQNFVNAQVFITDHKSTDRPVCPALKVNVSNYWAMTTFCIRSASGDK